MGYVDLIPDVFRLTMPDLATGKSYHTQKFNIGNKQCIGVTIKASQALSVSVAYGIATDTAAAAGVDIAASLPYKTSATSFASNTSTEGGTYHEIAVPPHARQAQLVISNASGSTVSGAVIDAALRVVAYPAASGSGSSDFASITGWPGSSSQFVHADGSYSPLSAADIPSGIDAAKLADGSVSNTELQYIGTLTSNAQTQISDRLPLAGGTMTGDLVIPAANLKPSGSGGSGHYVKQTSSGGAITTGTIAAADLPTGIDAAKLHDGTIGNTDLACIKDLATTGGSGHFLKQNSVGGAITSEVPTATDSTKLPLAGGTGSPMTGPIVFSNTTAPSGVQYICSVSGFLVLNADSSTIRFRRGGSNSAEIDTGKFIGMADGSVNTANTEWCRTATGSATVSPAGKCNREQVGSTAVANSTWTTIASLSGVAQGLIVAIVTGMGSVLMDFDGTTLTKLTGAATLVVAGSAGGTEVAFRVSGGNLQASNGTGVSKNVSCPWQAIH